MSTAYQARYCSPELTRQRPTLGVDRLSMSLFDACVDLALKQRMARETSSEIVFTIRWSVS